MKHRADVLQIERPGTTQTGGRHAEPTTSVTTKVTKKVTTKVSKAGAKNRAPQPDVAAGEEGTLSGGVVGLEAAPLEPAPAREPAAVLETLPERHVPEAAANPTEDERAASPLASSGKWRTRNIFRNLTFLLLVLAAAATGLAARSYFESTTTTRMRVLVTAALVVAGLWALLTATAPQVVTLKGSVLTVKSRRGTDRFDLAEGMTQLELIGEPTSSKWALVLHRGDDTAVRLGRRDVDARTLDPLVRQFREIAERRRSEHWARLGL